MKKEQKQQQQQEEEKSHGNGEICAMRIYAHWTFVIYQPPLHIKYCLIHAQCSHSIILCRIEMHRCIRKKQRIYSYKNIFREREKPQAYWIEQKHKFSQFSCVFCRSIKEQLIIINKYMKRKCRFVVEQFHMSRERTQIFATCLIYK